MRTLNIDNKQIVSLYGDGQSLREIGNLYKTDANTIKSHLIKQGIKIRGYSEALFFRHKKYKHPRAKEKTYHDGYFYIRVKSDNPYYSMAEKRGYIPEHRLLLAQNLGRCLNRWEIVHHKNGIKDDNRIENLILLSPSNHQLTEMYCRHCSLRNEIRLLRKYIHNLTIQLQERMVFK